MRLRDVYQRLFLVLRLELGAMKYPGPLAIKSFLSFLPRVIRVLTKEDSFIWLGRRFETSTRFEPLLMHIHQQLANDLLEAVKIPIGGKIIDIGAHNGQFAFCLLLRRPDLEVISLEPNRVSYEILRKNTCASESNGINWISIPYGIDVCDSTRELFFIPGLAGQASLYKENSFVDVLGRSSHDVASTTAQFLTGSSLNQLFKLPSKINLIKVDVEGHELVVAQQVGFLDCDNWLIEIGANRQGATSVDEIKAVLNFSGRRNLSVRVMTGSARENHDVLFSLNSDISDNLSIESNT